MKLFDPVVKHLDDLVTQRYLSRYVPLIGPRTFCFEDLMKSYVGEPLIGEIMLWGISSLFTSMMLLITLGHSSVVEEPLTETPVSINVCVFVSLATTALIIHGHIFLHHLFPGKARREAALKKKVEELIEEKHSTFLAERNMQANLVSELNNPKAFCQKHFNKKASGFIDFFMKRVWNFDKGVDFDFLYYALLIPKRKELSVDALRKILMVRKKVLPLSLMNSINKSEVLFQNYSLLQIETLFTMGKNDDYFKELLLQAEYYPLNIYKSFEEAHELRCSKRKIYHPSLLDLQHASHEKWEFKILKTKESYQQASADFSNCVKVYFEMESDIVLVFQDHLPYACVEIKGGKITEMSAHRNFPVVDETKLRAFLKFYLK